MHSLDSEHLILVVVASLAAVFPLVVIPFALCSGVSLKRFVFTGFGLFLIMFLLFVWSAPVLVLFEDGNVRPLITMIGALAAMMIGFAMLRNRRGVGFQQFISRATSLRFGQRRCLCGLVGLYGFLVAIGLLYHGGVPKYYRIIGGFGGFQSAYEVAGEVRDNRLALTKGHWFGQQYRGQGLFSEITKVGWKLASAIALIGLSCFGGMRWRAILGLIVITFLLFVGGTGERWPLVEVLICMLLVVSVVRRGIKVSTILLAAAAAVTFVSLISLTTERGYEYMMSGQYDRLAERLIHRIFIGNGVHDVQVIEIHDSGAWAHRAGMYHVEKFVSSFPGVRYGTPLGIKLTDYNFAPETTYSSGTYISMTYADFGLIGTWVVFLLLGCVVAMIENRLWRIEKTVPKLALCCMVMFYMGQMYSNGIIGLMSSMFIVIVCFCVFMVSAVIGDKLFSSRDGRTRELPQPWSPRGQLGSNVG